MTGDLDTNGTKIRNIADGTQPGDAINYKQFDEESKRLTNQVDSALPVDGSKPMRGVLNLSNGPQGFTNSSRVLPTSCVVYQLITHRNLWSIALI